MHSIYSTSLAKLALIMHRLWKDDRSFVCDGAPSAT
jgi:hypothetical protein